MNKPLQSKFTAALFLMLPPLASAFPLTTDDTGTQGLGHSKIELTHEREVERGQTAREISIVNEISLAHGFQPGLDGFFTLPYREKHVHETAAADTHANGVGDIKLGVKWRFIEREDISLALKADITAPTGDAARQFGSGKPTQTVNAIAGYAAAPWKINLNLAYTQLHNTRNQRESIGRISAALVRKLDGDWKIMGDIGVANSKSKAVSQVLTFLGAGAAYAVSRDITLEVGLKYGLSSAEADFTGLAGLNLRF